MAEFEEKLNAILGDQEAMGQIMALALSLSACDQTESEKTQEEYGVSERDKPEDIQAPSSQQGPDLSALFDQLDPAMLQMGMRILREYRGRDDRSADLLRALRPFVREERRGKLDKALQIAQMTRMIRVALTAMGGRGEEGDV